MLLVGFKADLFLSCMKSNAEHSGDLGVATKEPRKGRPAATGRELLRLVINYSTYLSYARSSQSACHTSCGISLLAQP